MKPRVRLRIVSHEDVVTNARVLIVETDDDGAETATDITDALLVTGIHVDLNVGEVAKARLECLCVGAEIDARLDQLAVKHLGRLRFGRLRWWIRRRWRHVETTSLGSRAKTYVRGLG